MQSLGKLSQKKSLIYFSNGISQSGMDNQSALRAATAAAVKANVSIYSMDVRGLQAFPPGGEAQSASLHGQSAYSGASVLNDLNNNASSQETLATLSSDTGGKAFDSIYITPNDNVLISWVQGGTGRSNGIELFDRHRHGLRALACLFGCGGNRRGLACRLIRGRRHRLRGGAQLSCRRSYGLNHGAHAGFEPHCQRRHHVAAFEP